MLTKFSSTQSLKLKSLKSRNSVKFSRSYAQETEVQKFLKKNGADFQQFITKYSGQNFASLEEAAVHFFGNANAVDMEKNFITSFNNLKQQAVARDFTSDFYKLNGTQVTLVNEYVTKELALKKSLEKKYKQSFPNVFKMNMANELLAGAQPPIKVAITGAAGAIGYSLAYRIASGNVFGPNTPVELQLLELNQALPALEGVIMELNDCAFPLLHKVTATSDPNVAFEAVDYALLVGAKPRGPGMERGDLLQENAKIFKVQGQALGKVGKGADTRVLVVGNPANTNALIAQTNAKNIPPENFSAMTRLDHNRGLAQLANKLNVKTQDIQKFAIWGNHSATQFPDVSHAIVGGEKISSLVDKDWLVKDFIPVVQQRGAAIIKARGASSAASAAAACLDGVQDWHHGTFGDWTSAAIYSKGDYGITEGIFYSYPVTFSDKQWSVVKDLPIDDFAKERMEATHKELLEERDAVAKLL